MSPAETHLILLISCTHSCLAQTTGLGYRAGFLGAADSCLCHRINALEEATSFLKISLIRRIDERGIFILYDEIEIQ